MTSRCEHRPGALSRLLIHRSGGLALVVARASLLSHAASAQSLSCGDINPHAPILAADQGQAPGQDQDVTTHPLPWSTDLGRQAGTSAAHKQIDATCTSDGASMTVLVRGDEWGVAVASRTNPNPTALAAWAPNWSTHVSLPAHHKLTIALSSSVNYLTC
jgi:hypothetical protein